MVIKLVLASGSKYKKQVLEKIGIPFAVCNPNIDESILDSESPSQASSRLSVLKAHAALDMVAGDLYLGLDQVVSLDGVIMNKPLTKEKAIAQLQQCNGKKVTFYTSICLLNAQTMKYQLKVDVAHASFRELSELEITAYVNKDMPLDCAGSFKSEGLGVSLLSGLETKDPNSVIGLPLIDLISMLQNESFNILTYNHVD